MVSFTTAVIAGAALASVAPPSSADLQVINPAELTFSGGRLGVPSATVGTPEHAGLYMFYVQYKRGMRSPLHVHRDDRMLTVLRGRLHVGQSADGSDLRSLKAIPAGSSILIRAGTPHFGWARDGKVLTQEIGLGPTSTTVVSPAP